MVAVTFTSWPKRIRNCAQVVKDLLDGSIVPDRIYLNLSVEEFPNKSNDLPVELIELSDANENFIINWVDGPNTKTYKKVFPILQYLDDDDVIVYLDDDCRVHRDFIKSRLDDFKKYNAPITSTRTYQSKCKWLSDICGIPYMLGSSAGSLVQKKMLTGYETFADDKECIGTMHDDLAYAMLIYLNGYSFHRCSDYGVWVDKHTGTRNAIQFFNENDRLRDLDEFNGSYFNNAYQNTLILLKSLRKLNACPFLREDRYDKFMSNGKKKVVVYCYQTNNVNKKAPPEITFFDSNISYVLYVDDKRPDERYRNGWELRQVESKDRCETIEDLNKFYKWHPYDIFKGEGHDIAIYIDSKVEILENPNRLLEKYQVEDYKLGFATHLYDYATPWAKYRDNAIDVFQHIDYLIGVGVGNTDNLKKWKQFLAEQKFPRKSNVAECAVIVSDLHNDIGKRVQSQIFDTYIAANTARDQVVVPYVLWKNGHDVFDCAVLGPYCSESEFFANNSKTSVTNRDYSNGKYGSRH